MSIRICWIIISSDLTVGTNPTLTLFYFISFNNNMQSWIFFPFFFFFHTSTLFIHIIFYLLLFWSLCIDKTFSICFPVAISLLCLDNKNNNNVYTQTTPRQAQYCILYNKRQKYIIILCRRTTRYNISFWWFWLEFFFLLYHF